MGGQYPQAPCILLFFVVAAVEEFGGVRLEKATEGNVNQKESGGESQQQIATNCSRTAPVKCLILSFLSFLLCEFFEGF